MKLRKRTGNELCLSLIKSLQLVYPEEFIHALSSLLDYGVCECGRSSSDRFILNRNLYAVCDHCETFWFVAPTGGKDVDLINKLYRYQKYEQIWPIDLMSAIRRGIYLKDVVDES